MATYVIGDIQGCFTALQALLQQIQFNVAEDILWFTGDLVNRGPDSLSVLRFLKSLGEQHIVVLGNHDLHLMAVAYGVRQKSTTDTLDEILQAPDCHDLIAWLQTKPFLHEDERGILVHAGIAPQWDMVTARRLAKEVEVALQNDPTHFLKMMYGNQPALWHENLKGMDRLRCITNYLTRMRFCHADGSLDFSYKGTLADKPAELLPWFLMPNRKNKGVQIFFGHWAALQGHAGVEYVYPLDTGCVWGNCLSALRLEDLQFFRVNC
jgi:bis(5'-nucleosyl)-tetraphosphatase (symmetrical)